MNKARIMGMCAIALLLIFGSVLAAETNIQPANMSGSSPAPEVSAKRARAAEQKKASGEPSFWQKEGERSGLSQTFSGLKSGTKAFFTGKWIKEQEEAYQNRQKSQ